MADTLLDDTIAQAVAMVIDSVPTSRSTLADMLRSYGVRRVDQIERPQDARPALQARRYDIVVCDSHFQGGAMSGQDLIDDLRQSGLLPLSTVVVMVSTAGDRDQVAGAAEVALDVYLLKPHTSAALRVRLAAARERKLALAEVTTLVEDKRFDEAAATADKQAAARGIAWLQAARIAADLYLRLGRAADAERMLAEVLKNGAIPWARLGLARAQFEAGAVFKARRTLEALIGDVPGYADAYDVMGRVLLEQGEHSGAIAMLRKALALRPTNVPRLVKLGLMAFYFGDPQEAMAMLSAAVRQGVQSKTFDLQGLTLLAALQFDRGDARGLGLSVQSMSRMRQSAMSSPRLRRFEAMLLVLQALLEHRPVDAVNQLNAVLAELHEPHFEFEAATNLLMVLSRLDAHELHLADLAHHIEQVARRFAVSRTTCDLLCATLGSQAALVAVVRSSYEAITHSAQQAIERTLAGEPDAAAAALLTAAEQTLNAKLANLARQTIERHKERIGDAPALLARSDALAERCGNYGTQVKLARVDDARSLPAMSRPEVA
jgi:DNA-binding response OmpR family regulator